MRCWHGGRAASKGLCCTFRCGWADYEHKKQQQGRAARSPSAAVLFLLLCTAIYARECCSRLDRGWAALLRGPTLLAGPRRGCGGRHRRAAPPVSALGCRGAGGPCPLLSCCRCRRGRAHAARPGAALVAAAQRLWCDFVLGHRIL